MGPVIGGVQALDLGDQHLADKAGAVGGAVNSLIMHYNQYPVSGAVNIHFQHIGAQLRGVLEGHHGVVRPQLLPSLMGNDKQIIPGKEWMLRHRAGGDSQYGEHHHCHNEKRCQVTSNTPHFISPRRTMLAEYEPAQLCPESSVDAKFNIKRCHLQGRLRSTNHLV